MNFGVILCVCCGKIKGTLISICVLSAIFKNDWLRFSPDGLWKKNNLKWISSGGFWWIVIQVDCYETWFYSTRGSTTPTKSHFIICCLGLDSPSRVLFSTFPHFIPLPPTKIVKRFFAYIILCVCVTLWGDCLITLSQKPYNKKRAILKII